MCSRHSKPWFIEPGATVLRAEANTMPEWKSHRRECRMSQSLPRKDPDEQIH